MTKSSSGLRDIRPIPVLILLIASDASLQAAPVHCPEQLKIDQKAVDLPPNMRSFDSETRHVWVNAQFSDGVPDEQAWLAPDTTHKNRKSFTNLWRLTPSASGTWLSCGYSGTSIIASFRLADGIRTCEVHYDANVSPPTATAIDCR